MMKNTGVRIQKPLATDYIAGAETGIIYKEVNPLGDWTVQLPMDERQLGKFIDTMACVSFSALNSLEAQLNFGIYANPLSKESKWLVSNKYVDGNGLVNISDRFTAKMSGTTKQGNYLGAVWDSIRHHGVLPEWDYPNDLDKFNWEEYYKEIPQELKDKASKFLEIFETKYEWITSKNDIEKHLKQAPIQIVSKVCTPWNVETIIPTCGSGSQHATLLINQDTDHFDIFDHYEPFDKKLALDFAIPYMMKGVITAKSLITPLPPFHYTFILKIGVGQSGEGVKALQTALKIDGVFPTNVDITGYYGKITQQAVLSFMKKYRVASPQEIAYVNGRWIGPSTRAKLNQLFS